MIPDTRPIVPDPRLALPLWRRPSYTLCVQFPVVCFVGALLTDLAYWKSKLFLWETFSVWLLAFGCLMCLPAGLVGLFHLLRDRRTRGARNAWPHALVSLAAALLAVANAFVHSRDGYTAVVPDGLALSAIVVALMVLATTLTRSRPVVAPIRRGVTA